jgi:hypothetical protein
MDSIKKRNSQAHLLCIIVDSLVNIGSYQCGEKRTANVHNTEECTSGPSPAQPRNSKELPAPDGLDLYTFVDRKF